MERADALVLDIGEDIGALVVYTDRSLAGTELDLVPAGSPRSHDVHNVVRPRTTGTGETVFAAVFPQVREGHYTLWGASATSPLADVAVVGGSVATVATARTGWAPA
jgi:hypothetical protein